MAAGASLRHGHPFATGAGWPARRRRVAAGVLPGLAAVAAVAVAATASPGGAQEVWPGASWATAAPESVGMDPARTAAALRFGRDRGGSGILVRVGKRVGAWGDQAVKYELKSTTKSFGSVLLGVAIKDGLVTRDTLVRPILPELGVPPNSNAARGWLPLIAVRHLATHTAGFDKRGGFEPLRFKPGTAWLYSDGGPNWLADLLTVRYLKDLQAVFRSRVLTPMGIGHDKVSWRRNAYREPKLRGIERREFGSGISAGVDVLARLGLMLLRDGRWKANQILTYGYANRATTPRRLLADVACVDPDRCPGANDQYGFLFWTNADGHVPDLPRDAFWSSGLHTSFVLVVPSLDLVAARASWPVAPGWRPGEVGTFFGLVAKAVVD
jgi:CubicO group peptidase (beta-lactamase class C family)